MRCSRVTETSKNGNFRSINGFHTPKLVRNDIPHLIVFCTYWWPSFIFPVFGQTLHSIHGSFRRAIYGYLRKLRQIFSFNTQVSTLNPGLYVDFWVTIFYFQLWHPSLYPEPWSIRRFLGEHFLFSVLIRDGQRCSYRSLSRHLNHHQ